LSAPASEKEKEQYLNALLYEVRKTARDYAQYEVDTIFIGGGTPSVVQPSCIRHLMETVRDHFAVSEHAEITIECNPGTIDREKLSVYQKSGINRLSIGLQTASDVGLKQLGRIHTWQDFLDGYALAREVGFDNINVDIMSALPGQSVAAYRESLQKVLSLKPQPEHFSAYSLIVEENTPFCEMEKEGKLPLPSEEEDREMYRLTEELLKQQGYHRYEISNYAKPGFECRHNIGYWRRTEYVGFGIGAASLVGECRFQNDTDLSRYIANPCGCRVAEHFLDERERMEEFLFLGLRMIQGVGTSDFKREFGHKITEVYEPVIEKNIADGLLYYYRDSVGKEWLALTKRGIDISNYVMAQFLLD